jgi:hypothetical protein
MKTKESGHCCAAVGIEVKLLQRRPNAQSNETIE